MKFYESAHIELKELYSADIKKEVVAFANTNGGTIYIGVKDNGDIVGIKDVDFVIQQASNAIRDGISPDVSMFCQIEQLQQDGLNIIKLEVGQATNKPYYLTDKGIKPSGVYVRQGTTAAPASQEAIRMMIKLSDGESFEDNRAILQNLTFDSLSKEMASRDLKFSKAQMISLGIVNQQGLYTNMGLIVSDQCKHGIKIAVFQGTDKLIFRDRKEIVGSLFDQLLTAYQTIDFFNNTKASFDKLLRIDERDYPEDAIREALLNAVVHRDYGFSGSIMVNIYADRLEIISPGGLVSGLSLEAALLGVSQPRNKNLAALFYRMRLIEAYGTGLSKIISSYSGAVFQPKFESVDGAFRVVLPNRHAQVSTITDPKILAVKALFDETKSITRLDVEQALDIGTTTAVKLIKSMLNQQIIQKIGSGKATKYILK